MKIPNTLPQFNEEKALIIIAGKQNASLYKATKGELDHVFSVKVPTMRFAENKLRAHSHGASIRSGAIKELKDENIVGSFLHEFKGKLKGASSTLSKIPFSKVFIFAPGQTKNKIFKALPYYWQKVSAYSIDGNFFNFNPMQLLGKLTQFPSVA